MLRWESQVVGKFNSTPVGSSFAHVVPSGSLSWCAELLGVDVVDSTVLHRGKGQIAEPNDLLHGHASDAVLPSMPL